MGFCSVKSSFCFWLNDTLKIRQKGIVTGQEFIQILLTEWHGHLKLVITYNRNISQSCESQKCHRGGAQREKLITIFFSCLFPYLKIVGTVWPSQEQWNRITSSSNHSLPKGQSQCFQINKIDQQFFFLPFLSLYLILTGRSTFNIMSKITFCVFQKVTTLSEEVVGEDYS